MKEKKITFANLARFCNTSKLFPYVILLVISLGTRIPHLSRHLRGDEFRTFSKFVLDRGFAEIIFGPYQANNHPLNSLIMKGIYLIAGENPALLRLPNLLFIIATILLCYMIFSKEFGCLSAFLITLLFSLHPAMINYSVWGRGYAGMIFFSLLSTYFFLQLIAFFKWHRLLLCTTAGFMAGMSHLFAVNVLIAQVLLSVIMLIRPESEVGESFIIHMKNVTSIALGPVIALFLVAATYYPGVQHSTVASKIHSFHTAFPMSMINFMGGYGYKTDFDIISFFLLIFALIGFFPLRKNCILRNFLFILFLAPVSLYLLSYFVPMIRLRPRFFTFLIPFYGLLIAGGLKYSFEVLSTKSNRKRFAPFILACAAALFIIISGTAFIDRTKVHYLSPRIIEKKQIVSDFLDNHPDAHILSNTKGSISSRLRQDPRVNRIISINSKKKLQAFLAQEPINKVYFIYRPQKRFKKKRLISYTKKIPPEELYRRDLELREFIKNNSTCEVEFLPQLAIYMFSML